MSKNSTHDSCQLAYSMLHSWLDSSTKNIYEYYIKQLLEILSDKLMVLNGLDSEKKKY